ncbi:Transposase family tnp2 [Rhizoctonia solani]|uniref:Transposase family tnp2 n=1 Tax=Rhizoctonia solani TaxID=456999 RepID=A0A8H8P062_9AGAM|nr:Transposase family tnp2 [Rhizoctonia solani]QRW21922.1 Transposase family tnp2 [Rhizoctonia solani]
MICTSIIPGPHSPKDLNSFLQLLINKLVELSQGVEAIDVVNKEVFALCAHILAAFGDLPAIAKLMEFVGHNGCFPCCLCKIMNILGCTAKNTSHLYCPLYCSDNTGLDPYKLPLCTHKECLKDGYNVLQAPNNTAQANLATDYSIKGVTLLAKLLSIWIPNFFPVKAMHLVWINLIPQLADLWHKKFNGIDSGFEDYLINMLVWNSMGDISQPNIPNPQAKALTVTPELRAQISKYLATTYEVQIGKKLALELIPNTLQQWGQMQITQGGNLIQAQGYHKLQWDSCNTSFVWYELLANQLAHLPRATPNFVPTSYYGQLQYLFKLPLKPKSVVNLSKDGSKYLILAFILEAPVVIEKAYEYRVTWYKGKLGSGEVVNALTIQCTIGQIQDNKRWWIIDRIYTCYALDEQSPGNPTLIHASDPSAQIRTPQISPTPDAECKSDPRPRIRPLRKCPTPNKPKNPTPEQKSNPSRNSDPWGLQTSDPREKVRPLRGFGLKKPNPSRNNPPAPGSGFS